MGFRGQCSRRRLLQLAAAAGLGLVAACRKGPAVSYTHLTLPTIYSV